MERVCDFLKTAQVYYLATVEGDQPRVRPFGTAHIFEHKLYIQTNSNKPVSHQLARNPRAELCAFHNGIWLRVCAELIPDERPEAKQSMMQAYPFLNDMYGQNDPNMRIFYLQNATATYSSFTAEPETYTF